MRYLMLLSEKTKEVHWREWKCGRVGSVEIDPTFIMFDAPDDESAFERYRAFELENNGEVSSRPHFLVGLWKVSEVDFDAEAMRGALIRESDALEESAGREREVALLRKLLVKYPDEGSPK